MEHFRRNPPGSFLLFLLGCSLGAHSAAVVQQRDRQQPISLDAASSNVDLKTNTVAFKDVVISQGDMKVQAERAHATGLDFDNSRWTFEGNVRINAEGQGNLHSDQAVVEFRNNRIAKATITGNPAEFEQKRTDSGQMARGRADQITYDVNQGTVRLTDDAWLCDGNNEISGPLLVYNIREQKVEVTSPDSDKRVHITIAPGSTTEPAKPDTCKPAPNRPNNPPNAGKPDPKGSQQP